MAMAIASGYYLFSPGGKAVVEANDLIRQLCITVFVFGILMVIINSVGCWLS